MKKSIALAVVVTLGLAACGGDSDSSLGSDESDGPTAPTEQADDSDTPSAPAPSGDTNSTLILDNGETFEFAVLCSLEPQMAAGSEILFSVTSYGDPGVDATQFGDEGTVTGVATISVWDGDYETLWEASTFAEGLGGGVELSLDGSTVTGSGQFHPSGDISLEAVGGEFTANC